MQTHVLFMSKNKEGRGKKINTKKIEKKKTESGQN